MKQALAALLLVFCLAAAGAENFNAETREFASQNNIFSLKAGYSGRGGAGRARLELRGAAGKKISSFVAAQPPFSVTISGDGRRLFFFCGAWGERVNLFALNVHAASGALLASHQVQMQGPAGEDISADFSSYALGADQGSSWSILVVNAESGKLKWRKKFKVKLAGVKLSRSGDKLLAVFIPGENSRHAVVFDKSGKQIWRRDFATENTIIPAGFSRGGTRVELSEEKMFYDDKDGYWHNKLLKKHSFPLAPDGGEEESAEEVSEE